jgi:hypothetical protein
MEYVLVALMLTSNVDKPIYTFEVMAEYPTMEKCEDAMIRNIQNRTAKMLPVICAKRGWE